MFREKKQIVIFIIAFATIGGFFVFRYVPLKRTMKATLKAKEDQNLIIAKGISDSEQLPVFTEQLNILKSKLYNYESNIPQNKNLDLFLKEIYELMNRYHLIDHAIKPLEQVEIDNLICIPVNMECRGSLSDIYEFYKNLQNLDRRIRIQWLKMENENDFNGEVKMETKVVIYCKNQIS